MKDLLISDQCTLYDRNFVCTKYCFSHILHANIRPHPTRANPVPAEEVVFRPGNNAYSIQIWTSCLFNWMPPLFPCCFSHVFQCPLNQVESGWGLLFNTPDKAGGLPTHWPLTLPGHNYLQLTPFEFQDRGSNPVL